MNLSNYDALFDQHFPALLQRYQTLLTEQNYDYLVIPSGEPIGQYLDDMGYPFKPNPHFKAVLPLTALPHSYIVMTQQGKPELIYYQPVDFWHSVPEDPAGPWTRHVDIHLIDQPQKALPLLKKEGRGVLLGQSSELLKAMDFSAHNPESLVFPLYWQRAYKSAYEIECMAEANRIAAKAHNAARDAFYAGESEQGINLAYIKATGAMENDMPYGNIVALNHNAAILHYTDSSAQVFAEADRHSFLIDAGAQVHGYASDITRTYAYQQDNEFAEMITAMDEMQLALVEQIVPGKSYIDLHRDTHLRTAAILKQFGFVDMEPEAMVDSGVSGVFFPHGLGHQIGLQVHDVGGHQTAKEGGVTPPPEMFPFLRNTRVLEEGQVVTIEPGLYFIDSLVAPLQQSEHVKAINWDKIEAFKHFGGIRIEDDVVVTEQGHRNLSREAFAELD
ncbi:Xaa-Pro dipeptidase [Pleionea sp. CnH1-48]|uniref:Xaa-Pro dipeptidase n=1 Tax=Pleionea sp. CnH1-48 TaxID=2954494 RepID=UPI002097CE2C|nr:Xaa-Pro dipeptidase [Pleionea sp. CnH1-48]MCO7227055.1 Xaa-Pro dipeptidase [Pleionea sp. CnH1-48]